MFREGDFVPRGDGGHGVGRLIGSLYGHAWRRLRAAGDHGRGIERGGSERGCHDDAHGAQRGHRRHDRGLARPVVGAGRGGGGPVCCDGRPHREHAEFFRELGGWDVFHRHEQAAVERRGIHAPAGSTVGDIFPAPAVGAVLLHAEQHGTGDIRDSFRSR